MGRAYEIDTHKAAEAKTEVPATPSSTLPSDLDPDPDFTGTNSTHADNRPYGLEYEQEEHGTRRFSSNFATLRRPSDGLAHYESSFRYAGHPSGNEGSQNALRWERRASASVTHWYEEDDTSGQSGIPYPLVEASTGLWKGSNEDDVELVDPTSTIMSEAVYLGATCTPASDTFQGPHQQDMSYCSRPIGEDQRRTSLSRASVPGSASPSAPGKSKSAERRARKIAERKRRNESEYPSANGEQISLFPTSRSEHRRNRAKERKWWRDGR